MCLAPLHAASTAVGTYSVHTQRTNSKQACMRAVQRRRRQMFRPVLMTRARRGRRRWPRDELGGRRPSTYRPRPRRARTHRIFIGCLPLLIRLAFAF
jgi:hypothetical protein